MEDKIYTTSIIQSKLDNKINKLESKLESVDIMEPYTPVRFRRNTQTYYNKPL